MINFRNLITTEYNDFIIAIEKIGNGEKGYAYDKETKSLHEVMVVYIESILNDDNEYETVEEYINAKMFGLSYDYTCEILTMDNDYAVALEIIHRDIATGVEEEELWNAEEEEN